MAHGHRLTEVDAQGAVSDTGHMGHQPSIYQPRLWGGCVEEGEEGKDRNGATYIQVILHGSVEHHQVGEEGAKVGNGALHHTLWGQEGQEGQQRAGTCRGGDTGVAMPDSPSPAAAAAASEPSSG